MRAAAAWKHMAMNPGCQAGQEAAAFGLVEVQGSSGSNINSGNNSNSGTNITSSINNNITFINDR